MEGSLGESTEIQYDLCSMYLDVCFLLWFQPCLEECMCASEKGVSNPSFYLIIIKSNLYSRFSFLCISFISQLSTMFFIYFCHKLCCLFLPVYVFIVIILTSSYFYLTFDNKSYFLTCLVSHYYFNSFLAVTLKWLSSSFSSSEFFKNLFQLFFVFFFFSLPAAIIQKQKISEISESCDDNDSGDENDNNAKMVVLLLCLYLLIHILILVVILLFFHLVLFLFFLSVFFSLSMTTNDNKNYNMQ